MINASHIPSGYWLEWEPSESFCGQSRAENPVPIRWCSCVQWQTKRAIIENNLFQFISIMKCNLVVYIWIHSFNYSLIRHKHTMFTNSIWVTNADSFCKTKFKTASGNIIQVNLPCVLAVNYINLLMLEFPTLENPMAEQLEKWRKKYWQLSY